MSGNADCISANIVGPWTERCLVPQELHPQQFAISHCLAPKNHWWWDDHKQQPAAPKAEAGTDQAPRVDDVNPEPAADDQPPINDDLDPPDGSTES